jgi:hypothetical protein
MSVRLNYAALALLFAGYPLALPAATTLQELLARMDADPMLAFGGIYINYSEILSFDAQATTLLVDGSVIIAHNADVTTTEQTTTPGTGIVGETGEAMLRLPLKIDTNVTGGSNQGMIEIDQRYYLSTPLNGQVVWLEQPGRGILAVNAASTLAHVTGSVTILSNEPGPAAAKITTSAVGASNYGSISVVLRNGESPGTKP